MKSLLTTAGDIIVRGASIPARLAMGSPSTALAVNQAGTALEYRKPGAILTYGQNNAKNAGLVTVTDSETEIVTVDLGTVAIGDRYLLNVLVSGIKTTTGTITISVGKDSGTASILTMNDMTGFYTSEYIVNGFSAGLGMFPWLRVTAAGTLVLKVAGQCSDGSLAVLAGNGQILADQFVWG